MPANELRLLALDGGGVRGLSSLLILEKLMEAVDGENPPKPCDYFDMIGGTSTGGLIAIMLGRLKMSVADAITAYLELSDSIFQKKKTSKFKMTGKLQGRFDSEELIRAVKRVIADQNQSEDILLKDGTNPACRVSVRVRDKQRNHGNGLLYELSDAAWRHTSPRYDKSLGARRATSAASSFFDTITIGRYGQEFVDGATGANNPIRELWDQADGVWGPLDNKLKCVVSIGTGVPSISAFEDDIFHIGETLLRIATESEMTAESFRRERSQLASSGRYYRFNVTHGLENIS
ncbi:hypothetical protein NX059_000912 [Plenodomus lindquistii]|nr:hypothetical protein NX059_000912 [Plenodomus lindquistii]